ncbi:MAG: hypothetical protein E7525_03915 [Ruminococcaceae bacterium]|nr:hypothetical protein [Oscillospiraceae bacterium]
MKKLIILCTILSILIACVIPMTVSAAGDNSFYTWLESAKPGDSTEITRVTKTANQLLSIRLVKSAVDEQQMETIKNMSQQDVENVKGMLTRVAKGVSFNASDEAVKYFKAASKNAPFVDIGFAEYHQLDFNIGFAIIVDDTFIAEGKTYYAYRYDSENNKLVALGKANVLFERMTPYIGFETNCVDDFFITDCEVDVNYQQNNAPPEQTVQGKSVIGWSELPVIVKLLLILAALAVVITVPTFVVLKIVKRQL